MNNQKLTATQKPGFIVAMSFSNGNRSTSNENENLPYPSPRTGQQDDESTDSEEGRVPVPPSEDPNKVKHEPEIDDIDENMPPEQPEIDPLEQEDRDITEIEEDRPFEQPETDPLEAPVPDLDEIDTDREIDTDFDIEERDNIDRDPTVQPGTDPMKTDNSQII